MLREEIVTFTGRRTSCHLAGIGNSCPEPVFCNHVFKTTSKDNRSPHAALLALLQPEHQYSDLATAIEREVADRASVVHLTSITVMLFLFLSMTDWVATTSTCILKTNVPCGR